MFPSNDHISSLKIYHFFFFSHNFSFSGTEKGLSYDAVKARILAVEKVESVHNLHLWSLTMNQMILSAHVATGQ